MRQQTIRRLRRDNTEFQVVNERLANNTQQLVDILGTIFVENPDQRIRWRNNPLLREFFIFQDDPEHPHFIPPDFLADEDIDGDTTEEEEIIDEDLERFENPGRLE